jgi:hypothetical protein
VVQTSNAIITLPSFLPSSFPGLTFDNGEDVDDRGCSLRRGVSDEVLAQHTQGLARGLRRLPLPLLEGEDACAAEHSRSCGDSGRIRAAISHSDSCGTAELRPRRSTGETSAENGERRADHFEEKRKEGGRRSGRYPKVSFARQYMTFELGTDLKSVHDSSVQSTSRIG